MTQVQGETYYESSPEVINSFVFGPGNITSGVHNSMMAAYTDANNRPVTGAVDDRSTVLGGQTFTKGVYGLSILWSASSS